jgi:hypothetical protein
MERRRQRSRAQKARDEQARVPEPSPPGTAPQLTEPQAARKVNVNLQRSDKRGKRSTAQKRAASRHAFDPIPAARPVAGAFGLEPTARGRNKSRS